MKTPDITQRLAPLLVAGLGLVTLPVLASAAPAAAPGQWEYAGEIYLWGADLDTTTPRGASVELPFDKVVDNLQMAFMGVFSARRDKLAFTTDLIYMDLSDRKNFSLPVSAVTGNAKAELSSWIITPTVGYNLVDEGNVRIAVLGGARYLDVEAKLNLNLDGPRPPGFAISGKDSFSDWNGIVGTRGGLNFADHWYVMGYADIGTGDSDLTWQAIGMVGYRFNTFDLNAGYRYLNFQFDDGSNDLMDELTVSGPFAGILFRF